MVVPAGEGALVTRRLRVHGIVQGVGFRPTVSRHAAATGVGGSVCNKGPYVEILAQGTPGQVSAFAELLRTYPPARAEIVGIDSEDLVGPEVPRYDGFDIVESERTTGEVYVSPDIAVCDECARELFDPTNRRYLHPFINCTCCGPRLTILDALPYDRERTSMGGFPMCATCEGEYHSPASRRYDAQPVCCNDCGPEVFLLGRAERGSVAITAARRAIAEGGIVAVKGIGGFHLCCDATDEAAVRRLRTRKHRPQKPFAVMMRDLDVVRRECLPTPEQEGILDDHRKPIVLLDRRRGGMLATDVAPGNPRVGVMLPYAPVQLLLLSYDDDVRMPDCLVMTSGNVSGAPICHNDEEARQELVPLADLVLTNDRPIRTRADDSVVDLFEGRPYMIRRSRGYAPLPVLLSRAFAHGRGADGGLPSGSIKVLAVGGELKNAFCMGMGSLFYPSAYVGDLADPRTVGALTETIGRMGRLLEIDPEIVACDLHPRYNATAVARQIADERGLRLLSVQHHHAHVVSCMAENDWEEPVIGVAFDGTGYGTDGSVWGGELMTCDYHGFERVGSIEPFVQVGGDSSAREGWRIAVALLGDIASDRDEALDLAGRLGLCDGPSARVQLAMVERRLNAVTSTSAGRLFDAVSALLGIRRASTFEGEASMALQFAAERRAGGLPAGWQSDAWDDLPSFSVADDGKAVLATGALVERVMRSRLSGADVDELAFRFHETLARMVADACGELARRGAIRTVALSGGCYQNRLLLALTKGQLKRQGLTVLTHGLIPPNDGGIALGQAVVAAQWVRDEEEGRVSDARDGRNQRIMCDELRDRGGI